MKQLLVFLFFLCATSVSAQDVIVKKDGSTIVCRVVELTATEITYKKWSDLNGSNYVMERSAASAINYEDGKKVRFSEVDNLYQPNNQNDGTQLYNDKALLRMDYTSIDHTKKVKTLKTIAWLGGGAFIGASIVSGILYYTVDYPDFIQAEIFAIASAGVAIAGTTTLLIIANHEKKKAQHLQATSLYQYNLPLSKKSSLSLGADLLSDKSLGQNTLGLGLRYNF